jgi:hypothetical protein
MITSERRERAQLSARRFNDISRGLSRLKEDFDERLVRTISAREIEEWLYGRNRTNGHGLTAQTLVNWRVVLNAFFEWLKAPPIWWTGKAQISEKELQTCLQPIVPMRRTSVRKR